MTAHNIPTPRFADLWALDPVGQTFWQHWLAPESWEGVRPHFQRMGLAGARASSLAITAERLVPTLQTHDECGDRIDEVVYHPAYRELEELSYGGGIVAIKYEPEFLQRYGAVRHLVGFGAGYYFAQSEAGLYCPICMTDGVGRVLERHGESELAREALARIASRDCAELWQGAMFLTERQGGSDVGANTVEARKQGDRWLLRGHKWFCSNVDANIVLVLARMPDGPSGTRGLGLFLFARDQPAENARRIRIERLKDKFGTRSMATGEVTLEDVQAELIGGAGQGFKMMAEMINLSRLYNSVASVAAIRRALLEAAAYGHERTAFGKRLWDLPLWRATVADVAAEHLAAFVTVFETTRLLDRADGGDDEARRLVRLMTPLCKAITAKLAVQGVSECMEAIGGNAYVETSVMPRLLRDAQVLPIWEGTTNILTLDVLRSMEREHSHESFLRWTEDALESASSVDPTLAEQVGESLQTSRVDLQALAGDPAMAMRAGRGWLERAWRTANGALLLNAARNPELREVCIAACRRVLSRPVAIAPAGAFAAHDNAETEAPLLHAAYSAPAT